MHNLTWSDIITQSSKIAEDDFRMVIGKNKKQEVDLTEVGMEVYTQKQLQRFFSLGIMSLEVFVSDLINGKSVPVNVLHILSKHQDWFTRWSAAVYLEGESTIDPQSVFLERISKYGVDLDAHPKCLSIINEFVHHGWKLPDEEKIRLPKIIFSDKIETVNGINGEDIDIGRFWGHMELLGCYRQNPTFQDWNHEGEIVIYVEKIRKIAERFDAWRADIMIFITTDMKFSGMSSFQILLEIVMAHEVTHWIMHWFTSPSWLDTTTNIHGFIPFKYETDSQVEFHESVAQLCTWFSIQQWHDIKEVFTWLLTGQPKEYSLCIEIFNKGVNTIEHTVKLMEAFRTTQCQEYCVLKCLADWEENHFDPFFSELIEQESEQQVNVIKNRVAAYIWLVDLDEMKINELLTKVKMKYESILVDDDEVKINELLTKLKIAYDNLDEEEGVSIPKFLQLAKLGLLYPGCKFL